MAAARVRRPGGGVFRVDRRLAYFRVEGRLPCRDVRGAARFRGVVSAWAPFRAAADAATGSRPDRNHNACGALARTILSWSSRNAVSSASMAVASS